MKERKPRPMNSAEPQSNGFGALIVGHKAKSLAGRRISTASSRFLPALTLSLGGICRHLIRQPS